MLATASANCWNSASIALGSPARLRRSWRLAVGADLIGSANHLVKPNASDPGQSRLPPALQAGQCDGAARPRSVGASLPSVLGRDPVRMIDQLGSDTGYPEEYGRDRGALTSLAAPVLEGIRAVVEPLPEA